MVESRRLRWIGPGVVALGAVGFIASTTLAAGTRPWTPRACAGPPSARIEAARGAGPPSLADLPATPWYRLDPLLDHAGALAGRRLAVGLDGGQVTRISELPAESFAAGPFGRTILVGSDDGRSSDLSVFDVATGCAWAVGRDPAVIRRATIDPTGTNIYEMRVDRVSRADLGIWVRPMDGLGEARRVLAPIAPDKRFGRTYSTEFTWDLVADRLAIQSCGEAACRVRIVAPGPASALTLDAPDLGLLIGLDGDSVVTYGACRGFPCPIVSTDVQRGGRRVLAEAAGPAVVVRADDGIRLVHEQETATGRVLRSILLDGSVPLDLGPLPDGLELHATSSRTDAATRIPAGWVLLAPDGRLPADRSAHRPQIRHIPDGITVTLDEAAR